MTGHGTSISNGNALVSIKDDSGEILWSWHLWFCTNDPRTHLDTYPNVSKGVMNRALGAKTSKGIDLSSYGLATDLTYWQDGLYYQWGRKDPLMLNANKTFTNKASGSSFNNSIENPSTYYIDWDASDAGWESTKTSNDPCPPGYKVPDSTIWEPLNSSASLTNLIGAFGTIYPYNIALLTDLSQNIAYPYSGSVTPTSPSMTNSKNSVVTYESPSEEEITLGVEVLGFTIASDKVKNLVLKIKIASLFGSLWASSPAALEYEFGQLDIDYSKLLTDFSSFRDLIDIVSCEVLHNNWEIKYSGWGSFKIPIGIQDNWETRYKPYPEEAVLTDNDKAILLYKLFTDTEALFNLKHKIVENISKANALQIRCIQM